MAEREGLRYNLFYVPYRTNKKTKHAFSRMSRLVHRTHLFNYIVSIFGLILRNKIVRCTGSIEPHNRERFYGDLRQF